MCAPHHASIPFIPHSRPTAGSLHHLQTPQPLASIFLSSTIKREWRIIKVSEPAQLVDLSESETIFLPQVVFSGEVTFIER
jgi:hypothetical protein